MHICTTKLQTRDQKFILNIKSKSKIKMFGEKTHLNVLLFSQVNFHCIPIVFLLLCIRIQVAIACVLDVFHFDCSAACNELSISVVLFFVHNQFSSFRPFLLLFWRVQMLFLPKWFPKNRHLFLKLSSNLCPFSFSICFTIFSWLI